MQFIPDEQEVLALFRETGALREGHFEYANGLHSNQHVETALAVRNFQNAKILSVALSRLLRLNTELRAILSDLSIVAASIAGLPIAYGLAEVLHPRQVYWAESPEAGQPMEASVPIVPGEPVILVDDILRSGARLQRAKTLLQAHGAVVFGIAVPIVQAAGRMPDFAGIPVYSLAHLEARPFFRPASCDLCRRGVPLDRIRITSTLEDAPEAAEAAAS